MSDKHAGNTNAQKTITNMTGCNLTCLLRDSGSGWGRSDGVIVVRTISVETETRGGLGVDAGVLTVNILGEICNLACRSVAASH